MDGVKETKRDGRDCGGGVINNARSKCSSVPGRSPPAKKESKHQGFLGSTSSSNFRKRAALDKIRRHAQAQAQVAENRTTSYVLVGGTVRQISPSSRAARKEFLLTSQDPTTESPRERHTFGENRENLDARSPHQQLQDQKATKSKSPRRCCTSSKVSPRSSEPKTSRDTEHSSNIPSYMTPTCSYKQRLKQHPSTSYTPRAVSLSDSAPTSSLKSFSALRGKIQTPSPYNSTASPKIKEQKTFNRTTCLPDPGLVTPSPPGSVKMNIDLSIPSLAVPSSDESHTQDHDSFALRKPNVVSDNSVIQKETRRQKNSSLPATRHTSKPTRRDSTQNNSTGTRRKVFSRFNIKTKDPPKGDNWAGVYSYFSGHGNLSDVSSLMNKSDNAMSDKESLPTGFVSPSRDYDTSQPSDSPQSLVYSSEGDKSPDLSSGIKSHIGDVWIPGFAESHTTEKCSSGSFGYSGFGVSSGETYSLIAEKSQSPDEFWNRASTRATDRRSTMELIHHASRLVHLYKATLTLQRWWFGILDRRKRQPVAQAIVPENDEENRWKDFNEIGAAMVVQSWWQSVSPGSNQRQRNIMSCAAESSEERYERIPGVGSRCVSPEAGQLREFQIRGEPVKRAGYKSSTSPITVTRPSAVSPDSEPPASKKKSRDSWQIEADDLERRAAFAQQKLEKRIQETLRSLKDSWAQRDRKNQRAAFLSAVEDLARLQEQSISLWKARYSQHAQFEAARKLQKWWRMFVAKQNYEHFACVADILPHRTKGIMRSKIAGPHLWGSLTRSRLSKGQQLSTN